MIEGLYEINPETQQSKIMLTIEEREFRAKLLSILRDINKNLEELNANLKRNNKENPEV